MFRDNGLDVDHDNDLGNVVVLVGAILVPLHVVSIYQGFYPFLQIYTIIY